MTKQFMTSHTKNVRHKMAVLTPVFSPLPNGDDFKLLFVFFFYKLAHESTESLPECLSQPTPLDRSPSRFLAKGSPLISVFPVQHSGPSFHSPNSADPAWFRPVALNGSAAIIPQERPLSSGLCAGYVLVSTTNYAPLQKATRTL